MLNELERLRQLRCRETPVSSSDADDNEILEEIDVSQLTAILKTAVFRHANKAREEALSSVNELHEASKFRSNFKRNSIGLTKPHSNSSDTSESESESDVQGDYKVKLTDFQHQRSSVLHSKTLKPNLDECQDCSIPLSLSASKFSSFKRGKSGSNPSSPSSSSSNKSFEVESIHATSDSNSMYQSASEASDAESWQDSRILGDSLQLMRKFSTKKQSQSKKKRNPKYIQENDEWGDQGLKDRAMLESIDHVLNYRCPCSMNCNEMISLGSLKALREDFWGARTEKAPTRKERRDAYQAILLKFYSIATDSFVFYIDRLTSRGPEKVLVCESAFLHFLVGGNFSMEHGRRPRQYEEIKGSIKEGRGIPTPKVVRDREAKVAQKFEHAKSYITRFKTQCDKLPSTTSGEPVWVLPYGSVTAFHDEYKFNSRTKGDTHYAQLTVFQKAYDSVKDSVRLMRCKGNFSTCDICNAANDLLADHKANYSSMQRELIMKWRRLHLKQQADERSDLDRRKDLARESYDENGDPLYALLFTDAMTHRRGNTPMHKTKLSHRSSSSDINAAHVSSRVIGVQVACGPINGTLLYYYDNFGVGGANIMIEVQRQALKDLGDLLADKNMKMPKRLMLQFDNCTENKNKSMFGYLSTLVEHDVFEEIFVNFLIVGHTHASIDQYFSVLSNKIAEQKFIGTPKMLMALLSVAHAVANERPLIPPQKIIVNYDVAGFFEKGKYLNKFKYYGTPHCFRFKKEGHLKCIMQYKMFSVYDAWLPQRPLASQHSIQPGSLNTSLLVTGIHVADAFEAVGGKDAFFNDAMSSALLTEASEQDVEIRRQIDTLSSDFHSLQACAMVPSFNKDTSNYHRPDKDVFTEQVDEVNLWRTAAMLKRQSSTTHGFIVWLEHAVVLDEDNRPDKMFLQPGKDSKGAALCIINAMKRLLGDIRKGRVNVTADTEYKQEHYGNRLVLEIEAAEMTRIVETGPDALVREINVLIGRAPSWVPFIEPKPFLGRSRESRVHLQVDEARVKGHLVSERHIDANTGSVFQDGVEIINRDATTTSTAQQRRHLIEESEAQRLRKVNMAAVKQVKKAAIGAKKTARAGEEVETIPIRSSIIANHSVEGDDEPSSNGGHDGAERAVSDTTSEQNVTSGPVKRTRQPPSTGYICQSSTGIAADTSKDSPARKKKVKARLAVQATIDGLSAGADPANALVTQKVSQAETFSSKNLHRIKERSKASSQACDAEPAVVFAATALVQLLDTESKKRTVDVKKYSLAANKLLNSTGYESIIVKLFGYFELSTVCLSSAEIAGAQIVTEQRRLEMIAILIGELMRL